MWVALLVAPLIEGNEDTQPLLLACLPSRAAKVVYAGANWRLLLLTDIRTQLLSLPRLKEDQWLSGIFQALGTAKAFGCGRSSPLGLQPQYEGSYCCST